MYCGCGCGRVTNLAIRDDVKLGWIKGQPLRFVHGHWSKTQPRKIQIPPNPSGICWCGCGETTMVSDRTNTKFGWVKGCHKKFIKGHGSRKDRPLYLLEDRGYKTPCWIWQRARSDSDYGIITRNGVQVMAYRVIYESVKGLIPAGLVPDHLCRIHPCVNPDHIEPVSKMVNVQRGSAAKLNPEAVLRMRELRRIGVTVKEIAKQYSVTPAAARRACNGRSWGNIP